MKICASKLFYSILVFSLSSALLLSSCASTQEDDTPHPEQQQDEEAIPVQSPADETDEEAVDAAKAPELKKEPYKQPAIEGSPVDFREVWGYVLSGRENQFSPKMPITDLCYFSAEVNSYGELEVPRYVPFKNYKGRVHLVITCTGRALTHFTIDPNSSERERILRSIAQAAKNYDGIQVDYENVGARDAKNFRLFLSAIRKRIGDEKWLTVALPARMSRDIIYDYTQIAPIVDRIIIMAYDEHWSGSKPGPVAGMDWCSRVADYCTEILPNKKIVMGLPFYGRSWQNESYGSAWIYPSITRILGENNVQNIERTNGIPHFSFPATIQVTGYFDDTYSLVERCRMYKNKNIKRIAFWRVGQEDPSFWPWLKINKSL